MAFGKRLAGMILAGTLAVGGGGAVALADAPKDWPQFHGPARDNVNKETGLLKQWPPGGPPLAWKITGIGDGHASVSVANGKVFTSGQEGNTVVAFALNESDGKQVWKAPIGGLGGNSDGQGGKGSRGTPTVDGDTVYVSGPVGDVVALAVADGKEAWRVNLKKDFGGGVPHWGYSDSLLVDGDNVVTIVGGKGGTVLALNKKTGKQAWRSKDLTDSAHYTSLVAAEIGGVKQLVVLTPESVAGIAPADGAVLWRAARHGETAVCPSPIIHNDHVFVTSGYGVGCDLFKVKSDGGKFAAENVYTNKNMINHHGGVILLDGALYGFSDGKGWVCMDFMSGAVKWSGKGSVGKGTLTYADGRFYLRDERKGTVALIEASPDAYKEVGKFEQPDPSKKPYWPHLVIANGKLYVRDMDTLLCYDVKAK